MHRFFLAPANWSAEVVTLDASESHHAADVLRLTEGERLAIFDGRGGEALGRIEEVSKKAVRVRIIERHRGAPLSCQITLAQAIPKGKNMDLIVQKAVELGAARIAPLISERTIVRLDPEEAAQRREKWQQVALEACKQCGQNWLPEVLLPLAPAAFLGQSEGSDLLLIASLQPDARPLKQVLGALEARPRSVTILIGPEGDFTPAELSAAKALGCQPITLGPIILRTETAAIYCLSVLAHELFEAA